jgi:hypothetical protein
MKIVSFLCVYNDWEYLDQAITAFKDYPDKLYIIEGSWKSSQKFDASPRSNELTYDIINKHVDNEKVFLVQANEVRERDQRQVGLELAKQDGADWAHMLDADEVYTKESLSLIKRTLGGALAGEELSSVKANQMKGFRLNSHNFINSFKRWYEGNYMRIYRVTPEARFVMDNDVEWPDHPGKILTLPGKHFFHYNYVKKNTDSFWLKMKYQTEQDPSFWKRFIDTGQYKEENGVYKIPDDCKVYDYTGKHPAIMKEHPYFVNDVFGDGEVEYGS